MGYRLIRIIGEGRDLDITRYIRHIEKPNNSRENMGEPAMKAILLYADIDNEDQELFKLQQRRLCLVTAIKVKEQRTFNRNLALIPCEQSWNCISCIDGGIYNKYI